MRTRHARNGHRRLDRAIQYSETAVIGPKRCGVLVPPLSRGMTTLCGAAPNDDSIDVLVRCLLKRAPQQKTPQACARGVFSFNRGKRV
jgi:hypothetical protein